MREKIYLNLLILCGILFQGIIETFADENISESSNFLVQRQKRVISYVQGEDAPSYIQDHPYVVQIKKLNRISCVGAILSYRVVITAAECVEVERRENRENYQVVSASTHTYRGVPHNVTAIRVHYGNHPHRPLDGIALLSVNPPIANRLHSRKIDLHVGPLLPGMVGVVSGWGYNCGANGIVEGTNIPTDLRSIIVPIIAHRECVNLYRNLYPISDKDICTFHPQRYCGHIDAGAPLVIDDSLVGIFIRRGPVNGSQNNHNNVFPDVFVLLQDAEYSRWIRAII